MAKNAMAERLADFRKFFEEEDIEEDYEPNLNSKAVRDAFEAFPKLDPQNPRHQRVLLLILAHIVFGRRKAGRPAEWRSLTKLGSADTRRRAGRKKIN